MFILREELQFEEVKKKYAQITVEVAHCLMSKKGKKHNQPTITSNMTLSFKSVTHNTQKPVGETCVLERVSPVHMFNLLQDMAVSMRLICDLQPTRQEFDQSHARASTYVEYDASASHEEDRISRENVGALIDSCFVNRQLRMRGLLHKEVVLYGEKVRVEKLAQWLTLENRVRRVYVLDCEYMQFEQKYPFACTTCERTAHQRSFPAEIVPGFLFLGGFDNARSREQLDLLGITHVLNMAEELDNVFEAVEGQTAEGSAGSGGQCSAIRYLKINVGDTVHDAANLASHLSRVLDWIECVRTESASNKVLVHCNLGISRSSTVVIAWLMRHYRRRYEDCFVYVRSMRCFISPNRAFIEQLKIFEGLCLDNRGREV